MNSLAGMRIVLVGPLPPPAGGMAMQTRQLCELLQSVSAQVAVVQSNAPYRPAFLGHMPGLRAVARLLPYVWRLWVAAGRSDVMHLMANSGWSWHLFATPAIWAGWLRGVPVVVNYRGGEAATFLDRSGRAVRASLRHAACLIVPSGFLQGVFGQHGVQASIVPNIVDLSRFYPAPCRPPQHHLLVARNLEPLYDNGTALRAFAAVLAKHPQARMTIAGSGPQEAELRALANTLGIAAKVRFAGRMSRQDMAELLRQSSVSINPSLADNMPNSVLEALASGVPVVSTNVGGVPFLVQDGVTALLVPARDAAAMAAAVLRVLESPPLADRLAAAGVQEASQYTWARVGPRLAAVYAAALSPHKA
jgi:glycosyltransferase involved in cell wall biosynthesis